MSEFAVNEKVLAWQGENLWVAKILKLETNRVKIHYDGWNSSYDEFVPHDQIIKDSPENRKLMQELKAKTKQASSGSNSSSSSGTKKNKTKTEKKRVQDSESEEEEEEEETKKEQSSSTKKKAKVENTVKKNGDGKNSIFLIFHIKEK